MIEFVTPFHTHGRWLLLPERMLWALSMDCVAVDPKLP